jgi:hypothetical protein
MCKGETRAARLAYTRFTGERWHGVPGWGRGKRNPALSGTGLPHATAAVASGVNSPLRVLGTGLNVRL